MTALIQMCPEFGVNWIKGGERAHEQKEVALEMKVDRIVGPTRIAFYCLIFSSTTIAVTIHNRWNSHIHHSIHQSWHSYTMWSKLTQYICTRCDLIFAVTVIVCRRCCMPSTNIKRVCCVLMRASSFQHTQSSLSEARASERFTLNWGDKSGFRCSCKCCNPIRHAVASSWAGFFICVSHIYSVDEEKKQTQQQKTVHSSRAMHLHEL